MIHFKIAISALMVVLAAGAAGCASSGETKKEVSKEEKARMYIRIGNGALLEGDFTGALGTLLTAERFDPSNPQLHHSKALAYYGKHEPEKAVKSAKRAVALDPKYADANNTLGKLLLDRGEYEEAEKYLKRAADDDLYRHSYKPLTSLGILHYRKRNYRKAEQYLERAILFAPKAACVAQLYQGHILSSRKEYGKAARSYQEATQGFCGKFPEAHFALGMTYVKEKRFKQARAKFVEIGKLYPGTKEAKQAMNQLRYLP